ncbi:MAG: 50S ribosomal protein L18 [Deltaproteobacteria bacterium]|nr:50S ribosomal protein L18 [Deltaproteobacteria bacterium]
MGKFNSKVSRLRRKKRVRKKIVGTRERPRLCVFRSARHIYAQIIDDSTGNTLVSVSSMSKDLVSDIGNNSGNKIGSEIVGAAIAKAALNKGIKSVVFDRNGFLYHGRVKALSESARKNGLQF